MQRQNYATIKGMERVSSAADARDSPDRKSQNFVGGGLMPEGSIVDGSMEMSERDSAPLGGQTFQEKHSPIHKAMRGDASDAVVGINVDGDKSPRVDLDPLARASRQRKIEDVQDQLFKDAMEMSEKDNKSNRPQTNSDYRKSPFNEVLPVSSHKNE